MRRWQAALTSVGSTADRLMRVKQVHGNAVRVLKRGEMPEAAHTQRPDGDAIVSNEAGLALAVMVADCVPILVCDPVRGAAAAIHAGWRGTCARVATGAIEAMQREFGSDPRSNRGDRAERWAGRLSSRRLVNHAFREAGHPQASVDRWFTRRGDKLLLDLWAANIHQLMDAGLDAGAIFLRPEHRFAPRHLRLVPRRRRKGRTHGRNHRRSPS